MAKEQFFYPETAELLKQLDEVARRSGVSRPQAFEDFLQMSVSALGHPLMEKEYLEAVSRHTNGVKGKRGCDLISQMFAELVAMMEETRADILGDLFQSSISHGEAGQFLTPPSLADAMARITLPTEPTGIEDRKTVGDPCCGSGRMLLAAAAMQPNWHFVGQDVDRRCVLMCAIGLALRNVYGHVVWGNSLDPSDQRLVYETGRVQVWGNAIRKLQFPEVPASVKEIAGAPAPPPDRQFSGPQLTLFD